MYLCLSACSRAMTYWTFFLINAAYDFDLNLNSEKLCRQGRQILTLNMH